jgi:protein TonB
MFEDSTFESTGKIRTRSRRWMLVTFALNASILLALILIPLIYPEALPRMANIMLMEAPAPVTEEAPKQQLAPRNTSAIQPQFNQSIITAPTRIPPHVNYGGDPPASGNQSPDWSGLGGTDTASIDNPLNGVKRPQVVIAKPKGPIQVSKGIMQGLLIRQVVPNYPPIPKAAHIEGTVILSATISKAGRIENLHVISGSAMFTQAAMDAVAQWVYRPYLLNGEPVEVETTVNVVFRLN